MSDVPLLDESNIYFVDDAYVFRNSGDTFNEGNEDEILLKEDVCDALRKFQEAELFHIDPSQKMLIDCIKCKKFFKNGYSVLNIEDAVSYFYCKNCWFKECFGVLDSQEVKK